MFNGWPTCRFVWLPGLHVGFAPAQLLRLFYSPIAARSTQYTQTERQKQAFSSAPAATAAPGTTASPAFFHPVHTSRMQALAMKYCQVEFENRQLNRQLSREKAGEWLVGSLLQLPLWLEVLLC